MPRNLTSADQDEVTTYYRSFLTEGGMLKFRAIYLKLTEFHPFLVGVFNPESTDEEQRLAAYNAIRTYSPDVRTIQAEYTSLGTQNSWGETVPAAYDDIISNDWPITTVYSGETYEKFACHISDTYWTVITG